MVKYRWYERLFFRLQLREQKYFRLVLILVALLIGFQALLTIPLFRKYFVLTEKYEGEPATLYKSLSP